MRNSGIIGRDEELKILSSHLDGAVSGKGSVVLLSGEAGIGKTRLITEIRDLADKKGFKMICGASAADKNHPFMMFSEALENELDAPLFHDRVYTAFTEIFAINRAGILVAKASPEDEEGLDADIFAGMLSAVQDFVHDSFDSSGEQKSGIGRLDYGDMKILIEHGSQVYLTAVLKGAEHKDMRSLLKSTVRNIDEEHGQLLETWTGSMNAVSPVQDLITKLADRKFLVRRDLEGVDLQKERVRISDRILQYLAGMAKERPLLLLLEDLHWSDESSLFVLQYLVRSIGSESIMILATSRPKESDILETALESMAGEQIFSELELKKLGEASVFELVNKLYAPNDFPAEFLTNLSGQCAGNPFFVIEMLMQMQDEGTIAQEGARFVLKSEDYAIPSSVEEVVHRRLDMLEPDSMAMLEFASCIGQSFSKAAALSFHSLKDTGAAFAKLGKSGIITAQNGDAGFSHAIFQDVVYNGIGNRWKAMYHKEIGEYYEGAYSDNLDDVLYELAGHFSKTGEYEKAYDYCLRAAEKAEGTFAAEQAIEFYNQALRTIPMMKTSADETGLLRHLGDVHELIGEFQIAIDKFNQVIEKTSDVKLKADFHRKIADNLVKLGESQKANEQCLKGLELLGDEDSAEKARLLLAQGWSFNKIGDFDKAKELFDSGMEMAKKFDMEKEVGAAHLSLGTMEWYRGNFDISLEYLMQSLDIRQKLGDEVEIARTYNNLGSVHHMKGELDTALKYKEKAFDMCKKTGDKMGLATALNNIGIVYWDRGDLETCLDYYDKSLAIKRQIGDKNGQATTLHNIGIIHNEKGEMETAIDYFEQGLAINKSMGSKHGIIYDQCSLAEILYQVGQNERALENASEALKVSLEIGAKGEAAWARRNVAKGLWKNGQWDEAKEALEKALAEFEEIGEMEEIPKTHFEFGNYWKEKGDADMARKSLEAALKDFEKMGQKLNIDKVKESLRQLEEGE